MKKKVLPSCIRLPPRQARREKGEKRKSLSTLPRPLIKKANLRRREKKKKGLKKERVYTTHEKLSFPKRETRGEGNLTKFPPPLREDLRTPENLPKTLGSPFFKLLSGGRTNTEKSNPTSQRGPTKHFQEVKS